MRKLLILAAIINFIFLNPALAINEINKTFCLSAGYIYLFSFDEKIIRYKLGNPAAAKLELMTGIINTNQDMLIKPAIEANTNLIIWTNSNIYNFNLSIVPNNSKNPSKTELLAPMPAPSEFGAKPIQTFYKNNKPLKEVNLNIRPVILDKPPVPIKNDLDLKGFQLDKPPGVK